MSAPDPIVLGWRWEEEQLKGGPRGATDPADGLPPGFYEPAFSPLSVFIHYRGHLLAERPSDLFVLVVSFVLGEVERMKAQEMEDS